MDYILATMSGITVRPMSMLDDIIVYSTILLLAKVQKAEIHTAAGLQIGNIVIMIISFYIGGYLSTIDNNLIKILAMIPAGLGVYHIYQSTRKEKEKEKTERYIFSSKISFFIYSFLGIILNGTDDIIANVSLIATLGTDQAIAYLFGTWLSLSFMQILAHTALHKIPNSILNYKDIIIGVILIIISILMFLS